MVARYEILLNQSEHAHLSVLFLASLYYMLVHVGCECCHMLSIYFVVIYY